MSLRARGPVVFVHVALLLGAVVAPAPAQKLSFSAAASASWAKNSVMLLGYREAVEGPWVGGAAEGKLGPFVLRLEAFRGTLKPQTGGSALERDGGEVRGTIRLEPVAAGWLGLESGYAVRAFSSAAGYQRWTIPTFGVRVSPRLGHRALRGYLSGHYAPPLAQKSLFAGQSSGGAIWNLGLMAEAGLVIAPVRGGPLLGIRYHFERFDFPNGAAGRLDQFEQVAVFGGFRVGR